MKTNATRYLDGLGIPYELREYTVDEDDLGAIKVAYQIGLPEDQVFRPLLPRAIKAAFCSRSYRETRNWTLKL